MSVTNIGWFEALSVIRASRKSVNPNYSFQQQLMIFQNKYLTQEHLRLFDKFPRSPLRDAAECQEILRKLHEKHSNIRHQYRPDHDIYSLSDCAFSYDSRKNSEVANRANQEPPTDFNDVNDTEMVDARACRSSHTELAGKVKGSDVSVSQLLLPLKQLTLESDNRTTADNQANDAILSEMFERSMPNYRPAMLAYKGSDDASMPLAVEYENKADKSSRDVSNSKFLQQKNPGNKTSISSQSVPLANQNVSQLQTVANATKANTNNLLISLIAQDGDDNKDSGHKPGIPKIRSMLLYGKKSCVRTAINNFHRNLHSSAAKATDAIRNGSTSSDLSLDYRDLSGGRAASCYISSLGRKAAVPSLQQHISPVSQEPKLMSSKSKLSQPAVPTSSPEVAMSLQQKIEQCLSDVDNISLPDDNRISSDTSTEKPALTGKASKMKKGQKFATKGLTVASENHSSKSRQISVPGDLDDMFNSGKNKGRGAK